MHSNGTNCCLFVNGTKIHTFKAKSSEIIETPLCLGIVLKDFSVYNIKKAILNGYVYGFSVDYDAFQLLMYYTFPSI